MCRALACSAVCALHLRPQLQLHPSPPPSLPPSFFPHPTYDRPLLSPSSASSCSLASLSQLDHSFNNGAAPTIAVSPSFDLHPSTSSCSGASRSFSVSHLSPSAWKPASAQKSIEFSSSTGSFLSTPIDVTLPDLQAATIFLHLARLLINHSPLYLVCCICFVNLPPSAPSCPPILRRLQSAPVPILSSECSHLISASPRHTSSTPDLQSLSSLSSS